MRARVVAVFASTRADLWPLSPVISALRELPGVRTVVFAGGDHSHEARVAAELGLVEDEIVTLPIRITDDSPQAIAEVLAEEMTSVSRAISLHHPDVILVLGDRYELLPLATVALLHGVPLAHIHGGEVTEGAFDDAIRNAVTKLAHLHFCATERAAARIRAMGEEAWRVHVTGAPGLDRLTRLAAEMSLDEACLAIGIPWQPPVGLLTYHAPTLAPAEAMAELDALIEGADRLRTIIATPPGPDPGSGEIVQRLEFWRDRRPGLELVPSLGVLYPTLMAASDVVLGNSSSGIIEAPTLGTPVVNIGDRQRGRERSKTVIDVKAHPREVAAAIDRALDPAFRRAARDAGNPWGDGHAATRIAGVLRDVDVDHLLVKRSVSSSL